MLVTDPASSSVKISCGKGVGSRVIGQAAGHSPLASLCGYSHTNTPCILRFQKGLHTWVSFPCKQLGMKA